MLTLGWVDVGTAGHGTLLAQSTSTSQSSTSWFDSMTSGIKRGFAKIGNTLTPTSSSEPKPEDSAISLNGKGKPGADLYVAVAHLHESANRLAEAEQQYQLALNEKPDYLPALLGYAQLKDRLGKLDDALRLYRQAAKSHPQAAAVYNNWGLCYARNQRLPEAAATLGRAVHLEPRNPLYRNNLAAVLVEQGQLADAVKEFRHVHGPAGAYYNVGYLLHAHGQPRLALQYFALALRADPSLTPARRWFDYLQHQAGQTPAARPSGEGVTVGMPAASGIEEPPPITPEPLRVSQAEAPLPPNGPPAQRLPPTSAARAASDASLQLR